MPLLALYVLELAVVIATAAVAAWAGYRLARPSPRRAIVPASAGLMAALFDPATLWIPLLTRYIRLANVLGLPAVVAPVVPGRPARVPAGVQLLGAAGSESTLIALGCLVEPGPCPS